MTALSYCGETVRKYDPDRFLLCLFAPVAVRESLFALYAFHYEIAKTREVVTETQLGLIRLQWWRDALAGIYERDTVLKHQVLEPLAVAIKAYDLPRTEFDNMIYAREFDLEDRQPAHMDGLVNYADYTATPLLQLALRIMGITADDAVIKAVATGYALTGILRAVPAHLAQRRCYLPEDRMHQQEISVYDLYDGTGIGKLPPVVSAVAQAARAQWASVPAQSPVYLRRMVKLSQMYLGQIESARYDVFARQLHIPPFMRELRLWWA